MIVQAGALPADVPGKTPAAVREQQRRRHRVDDSAALAPAAEGPVIVGAVLQRPGSDFHPRVFRPAIYADEGIALVVLEQNVVVRLMPFDQRVFQNQRFKFAAGNNDLKVSHLFNHGRNLREMLTVKVAAYPVLQFFRFADINHCALCIQHQVDARQKRKAVCFVKQCFHGSP